MQAENPVSLYFRARLLELLRARGITQRQLALDCGLSQQTINNYVRGVSKLPGAEELLTLARFFKVSMESLLLENGGGEKGALVAGETAAIIQPTEMLRAAGRMRELAKELCLEAERLERGGGKPGRR